MAMSNSYVKLPEGNAMDRKKLDENHVPLLPLIAGL
jgi:hypothetical protein